MFGSVTATQICVDAMLQFKLETSGWSQKACSAYKVSSAMARGRQGIQNAWNRWICILQNLSWETWRRKHYFGDPDI